MGKRAKLRAKVHEGIEIRYNDDGTVEQVSDECYWIGLAPPKGDDDFPVHVDLYSEKPISARVRLR